MTDMREYEPTFQNHDHEVGQRFGNDTRGTCIHCGARMFRFGGSYWSIYSQWLSK